MKKTEKLNALDEKFEIGRKLYEMTRLENEGWYRFYLPSGNELATEFTMEGDNLLLDVSIVNETCSFGNEPASNAFYFYDANDFTTMDSSWTLEDCIKQAEYILELDQNFRFDQEDKENFIEYLKKEFPEPKVHYSWDDRTHYSDFEDYLEDDDVCNEFISSVNKHLEEGECTRDAVYSALSDLQEKMQEA